MNYLDRFLMDKTKEIKQKENKLQSLYFKKHSIGGNISYLEQYLKKQMLKKDSKKLFFYTNLLWTSVSLWIASIANFPFLATFCVLEALFTSLNGIFVTTAYYHYNKTKLDHYDYLANNDYTVPNSVKNAKDLLTTKKQEYASVSEDITNKKTSLDEIKEVVTMIEKINLVDDYKKETLSKVAANTIYQNYVMEKDEEEKEKYLLTNEELKEVLNAKAKDVMLSAPTYVKPVKLELKK